MKVFFCFLAVLGVEKQSQFCRSAFSVLRAANGFPLSRERQKQISVLNGVNPFQTECNLKKQSQFTPGLIGVTSYLKGDYGKIPV
jgi:hypothetical protein